MKLRVIATFFAILAISAGSLSAQSIGIFSDPTGADCNPTAALGLPGTAFILFIPGGGINAITGAEFQITGMPASPLYFVIPTANALANVNLGSVFGGGANIAFPNCQNGLVTLYTVTIINGGDVVGDHTLSVEQHTSPTNPNFQCSLVTLCDAPVFTKVCVPGGQAFLNSGTRNCTVAVEETSWSTVKGLYN